MKQILIDTNITLRLLIGDVPDQLTKAKLIFADIENAKIVGLISILVVNELIWILEYFYNKPRNEYLPLLSKLFSLKNIKTLEIKKPLLFQIFNKMEKYKLDFTDIYLWFLSQEKAIKISTFDKKLLKLK
jgi:predicted nucleic acid-binding protein